MRAREADFLGTVDRSGVGIAFELFGDGRPQMLFLPASPITHSREWKAQVPFLARQARVVTYDGRGNGRSARPNRKDAYTDAENVADALAVMDATGLDQAVLVTHCHSTRWGFALAAEHPDRVLGIAAIGPGLPFLGPPHPHWKTVSQHFDEVSDHYQGWHQCNRHYWLAGGYSDWIEFFFGEQLPEPHSSKQLEDTVAWALETTPEVMLLSNDAGEVVPGSREEAEELCRRIECPVLVVHGTLDQCQPVARGAKVAELTGGSLAALEGSGHQPHARDPVKVNSLLSEFARQLAPPEPRSVRWTRAKQRPRRALFVSSPIGLGHIQRDLAVARELRALVPELKIDWWTQHPVTRVLEEAGENVHPMSYAMASESQHWEQEATEHELHGFYAFRRMDEIFVANFMLFHDVVSSEPYDLWIGDEAWEVDYYLHENPELKTAPYAFLTDVIGFLPVDPRGDPREVELTADYNAEMIAQRERYPYVRDLSLYLGDFEDLPDATFGPGLPHIQAWARKWFEAVGYIVPFDPADYADVAALRRRFGYRPDGRLLLAGVGGTAVGRPLLTRIISAFELLKQNMPEARLVMITGPRIDPDELPDTPGLVKRAYVHNAFEHLACADLAVVQGGLSTTMELVATRTPFIYLPLAKHWEQQHHVAYRLDRYRAGKRLDYAVTTGETLAKELDNGLNGAIDYREVPRGAARRAAERIAGLL